MLTNAQSAAANNRKPPVPGFVCRINQLQRDMNEIGALGIGANDDPLRLVGGCDITDLTGQHEFAFIALHADAVAHLQITTLKASCDRRDATCSETKRPRIRRLLQCINAGERWQQSMARPYWRD